MFEKLLHLKKSYFEDKNSAEILSFLQMDVSQISSITDRYTVLSVSYVFRIVSGLIGLFLISWKLALIVLCMVPVKFLLVRGLSKRQEQAMDEMIESSRDFSRWFGDDLNGVDEIKLWDLFQSRDQVFREKQEKVLGVQKRTTMIGGWNSFWEMLLEWSVTILLYVLGGWLICTGGLTIGAVFAFVSYSGYVTGPVSALINLKMYFARIFPSARRLFRFLDMETELDAGTSPLKGWPPKLEFRNVEFWYEEERSILQGVTFSVEPGEKVAIIGQNGSGKSTILNLLLRFYEPKAGQILADGVDVQAIPLEEYKARCEKYAKIISKTIILSGMDAASFGQNAYFYDAAEGLLTATILLVAEFCEPKKRHIVSVFKIIQELLAPSGKKGKNQFQQLMELLPNDHKAKWFAGAALNTAEQSMASVMSTALSRLNAFLDSELEQILCFDTEIDAEKFCKEKSALFIIMPEENPATFFMISLIIQQL